MPFVDPGAACASPARSSWVLSLPRLPGAVNTAFVTQVPAPAPPPPPVESSRPPIIWYPTHAGHRAGRQPLSLAPEATNNQLITAPLCGNNGVPKSSAGQGEEVSGQ